MPIAPLPYEEAAEHRTNLSGWVCKTCRKFWGEDNGGEHIARYCCAGDLPCKTEGCKSRVQKHTYIYCQPCLNKRDFKRWLALQEVPWDGKVPLVLDDDDRYFFDEDDLREYAEEHGMKPWELRLVVCVEETKPSFDMYDFLQDYLCDGQEDEANWSEIDKTVNDWIVEHVPTVWVAGKQRVTEQSLREIFAE